VIQPPQGHFTINGFFWLTDTERTRLQSFFPKGHRKLCVDNRPALSDIILISRNCLRWWNAPNAYRQSKARYYRWKRWTDKGVFAQMMDGSASDVTVPKTVMIDATYLKAHRTGDQPKIEKGADRTKGAV
jgi:transposase